MTSIVQCLLRSCLERDGDGVERIGPPSGAAVPPRARRIARRTSSSRRGGYLAPTAGLDDPHEVTEFEPAAAADAPPCCEGEADGAGDAPSPGDAAASSPAPAAPPADDAAEEARYAAPAGGGLRELLRRWGAGLGRAPYGPVPGVSPSPSSAGLDSPETAEGGGGGGDVPPRAVRRPASVPPPADGPHFAASPGPPLRQASSFAADGCRGGGSDVIPAISLDEVVLPGSDLQKQMSVAMAQTLEAQGDECVICLEGFDPTNPRMPTLCGCGENRTYFHLPCLYQWIDQDRNCPSCRKKLRWEEF